MVFGKKKKEEPVRQDAQPIVGDAHKASEEQLQKGAHIDLHGAIDEYNATFGGMFEPGDSSQNSALLFAIYTELRAIRLQNK